MVGPDFDSIKHLNPYNVEYWEARELMPLLGYGNKWQNFVDVIKKAMVSCETTGNIVTDHSDFPESVENTVVSGFEA
jgi:DNA-damage-inducible protein D